MTVAFIADYQRAWDAVAGRFEAYAPVWPGDAAFICQPQVCDAYCCRTMTVALDDADVDRMATASQREPVEFLECEDGSPIELPMLKPYILARRDARCLMLGDDLACDEYEGRPDACRQYPYQVLFIDIASGRFAHLRDHERAAAIGRTISMSSIDPAAVAFLVRHTPCPGFTGEPLAGDGWLDLFRNIATTQFGPSTWFSTTD